MFEFMQKLLIDDYKEDLPFVYANVTINGDYKYYMELVDIKFAGISYTIGQFDLIDLKYACIRNPKDFRCNLQLTLEHIKSGAQFQNTLSDLELKKMEITGFKVIQHRFSVMRNAIKDYLEKKEIEGKND